MTPDHEALIRLGRLTHEACADIAHDTPVLELYRQARDVAEARIPGPLGVAVAANLGHAAYEREGSPLRSGSLGSWEPATALALAVLALPEDRP